MSSRPARKRHSTTFYRDEQYNAPPSSARKSLPAKFMDGVEPSKIPEVLYAPDGRKFYPCKYCCKAFAFKKGQVSHIKACAYQSIEVSDDVPKTKTPVKQKALKVDLTETENLLTPLKFEAASTCPEYKQKKNSVKIAKRKGADFSVIPSKRVKQEFATMPVLKREPQTPISERVKDLDSVSLIPIKKESKAPPETVDIHKPTNCKPCKRMFPNAIEYLRHKREVHLGNSWKMSPESLKVYDKIYMSAGGGPCPICKKPMKLTSWKRHLLTHSSQWNHVCEFCKKGFHRIDHLKVHMKRHVTEMEM